MLSLKTVTVQPEIKKARTKVMVSFWARFGFFAFYLLFCEAILRHATAYRFWDIGLLYILLLSTASGLVLSLLCGFFKPRVSNFIMTVLLLIAAIFYSSQLVYHQLFSTFYTTFSLLHSAQITEFWKEGLLQIWQAILPILLIFLPVVAFCVLCRFFVPRRPKKHTLLLLASILIVICVIFLCCLQVTGQDELSPFDIYYRINSFDYSADGFGVLTAMRLDAQRYFFGFSPVSEPFIEPVPEVLPPEILPIVPEIKPVPPLAPEEPKPEAPKPEAPKIYGDNVLDFDFNALASAEENNAFADLNRYFATVSPSKQNEMTGIYKGKNLIYITAEGFSPFAVDEKLTPTLYKMVNSGYYFENFYTPIWSVSTLDGEYVNCQSLVPKSGVWSMYRSRHSYLPFTLGNQFMAQSAPSFAYHNHTYDYYNRDTSHPNMGYVYKGLGNGLPITKVWPESDLELMEVSFDEYAGGRKPFHVYYLTVSGHLNYTFAGNSMSARNKDAVRELPYSEPCRAYIACNIELEKAMAYLLERLESADLLDDTVIALMADHHPYGLKTHEMEEMSGAPIDETFELYRSNLILYKHDTPHRVISKPCCNMDVLPTVSNMFALPFDSRLMMGRDIFSQEPALVLFSDRSWISDNGRYNAKAREFFPNDGFEPPEGYVKSINSIVADRFKYSTAILDNDYYRYLFKK